MSRYEFTLTQQNAIRARSNDVCEAGKFGTYKMYAMADADLCSRRAEEIDHIVADALARRKPTVDDGLHVCAIHHKIKTAGHDMPRIAKAKRLSAKQAGIKAPSKWAKPGNYQPRPVKQLREDWIET